MNREIAERNYKAQEYIDRKEDEKQVRRWEGQFKKGWILIVLLVILVSLWK
jgi:hypothetical protein